MFFHYPKIQILMDQGRMAEAEKAIKDELQVDIENGYLYCLLSIAKVRQNHPKHAEEAARQAVALDPESDFAYYVLSRALVERKKGREALAAIDQAIEFDPDAAEYYGLKARILHDLSRTAEAIKATEVGLALDPENDTCLFYRSVLLGSVGRTDEAEAESLKLLSYNPEDADNHSARGWVLLESGDGERAEQHFIEALRINPEYEDARMGLAHSLKLRNPLLGWMLRLIMLSDRVPWWYLLGGLLIVQTIGNRMLESEVAPLVYLGAVVKVGIFLFLLVALTNGPLFNQLLMFSRKGRLALSDDERRAVRWAAVPLFLGWTLFAWWAIAGKKIHLPYEGIAWLAAAAVIARVFETRNPWVRRWMRGLAILSVAVAVWIEVALWGIILPAIIDTFKSMVTTPMPEPEAAEALIKSKVKRLLSLRLWLVFVPSMCAWVFAAFADDFMKWLHRRAPDATE